MMADDFDLVRAFGPDRWTKEKFFFFFFFNALLECSSRANRPTANRKRRPPPLERVPLSKWNASAIDSDALIEFCANLKSENFLSLSAATDFSRSFHTPFLAQLPRPDSLHIALEPSLIGKVQVLYRISVTAQKKRRESLEAVFPFFTPVLDIKRDALEQLAFLTNSSLSRRLKVTSRLYICTLLSSCCRVLCFFQDPFSWKMILKIRAVVMAAAVFLLLVSCRADEDDSSSYCRISPKHTMCRFQVKKEETKKSKPEW